MKRLFEIFAVLMFVFVGCDQMNELGTKGIGLVYQSDTTQVFPDVGGKVDIAISANENWTAESDAKWCIVTPRSGTAMDTKVSVLVDKNKDSLMRTATVVLKTTLNTLKITIEQQQVQELDSESDSVQDSEVEPEGEPETFLFMLTHDQKDFPMPVINGDFKGTVFWGDGREEDYSSSVTRHSYGEADERVVVMMLDGNSEDFEVSFSSLDGILKIDLSGL